MWSRYSDFINNLINILDPNCIPLLNCSILPDILLKEAHIATRANRVSFGSANSDGSRIYFEYFGISAADASIFLHYLREVRHDTTAIMHHIQSQHTDVGQTTSGFRFTVDMEVMEKFFCRIRAQILLMKAYSPETFQQYQDQSRKKLFDLVDLILQQLEGLLKLPLSDIQIKTLKLLGFYLKNLTDYEQFSEEFSLPIAQVQAAIDAFKKTDQTSETIRLNKSVNDLKQVLPKSEKILNPKLKFFPTHIVFNATIKQETSCMTPRPGYSRPE